MSRKVDSILAVVREGKSLGAHGALRAFFKAKKKLSEIESQQLMAAAALKSNMNLVISTLVQHGGNPCVESPSETPLIIAACAHCWKNVNAMLEANPAYLDSRVMGDVLMMAHQEEQAELVFKLVSKGAIVTQPEDGESLLQHAITEKNWSLVKEVVRQSRRENLQDCLAAMTPGLRSQLILHFSTEASATWAATLRKKGILLDEPGLPERGFPVGAVLTVETNPNAYVHAAYFLQFALRFQHEFIHFVLQKIESYGFSGQLAVVHEEESLVPEFGTVVDLMDATKLIRLVGYAMSLSSGGLFEELVGRVSRIRAKENTNVGKYLSVCRVIQRIKKAYAEKVSQGEDRYVLEALTKIKKELERSGRSDLEANEFKNLLKEIDVEHVLQIKQQSEEAATQSKTIKQLLGEELFSSLVNLNKELLSQDECEREASPRLSMFTLQNEISIWPSSADAMWWKRLSAAAGQEVMTIPVEGVLRKIQALPIGQQVLLLLAERDGYCVVKDKRLFAYIKPMTVIHLMHEAAQLRNWEGLCQLEDLALHLHESDQCMHQYCLLAKVICQLKIAPDDNCSEFSAAADSDLLIELQSIFRLKVDDCVRYGLERERAKESGEELDYTHMVFPHARLNSYLSALQGVDKIFWDQTVDLVGIDEAILTGQVVEAEALAM